MKLDRKERARLHSCPAQKIPHGTAVSLCGRALAQLLDEIASGSAEQVKQLAPEEFDWYITWDRCQDPDYIPDDPALLTKYFSSGSKCYLKACGGDKGGRYVGFEELTFTPAIVAAKYEQHSRGLVAEKKRIEASEAEEPEEVVGRVVRSSYPSRPGANGALIATDNTLLASLERWLAQHPKADSRCAKVARVALEQLQETGG